MNSPENKPVMSVRTAVALGLLAVVSFGAATKLEIWRTDTQSVQAQTIVNERLEKLQQTREGMAKEAASYRWINKADGVVQIPIRRAMEVIQPELQASTARRSSVPVLLPAAAPVEVPAIQEGQ
ncbi:MAG: hypothetical protein ACFCUX_06980 [Candidatus Methylacidiphilales bacterium]